MRLAQVSWLCALLVGCGPGERTPLSSESLAAEAIERRAPLAQAWPCELASADEDPVLGYRWGTRGDVPAPEGDSFQPPWGELGVRTSTRLYLPAHSSQDPTDALRDRSGRGVAVVGHGVSAAAGLIGGGLALSSDRRLEIGTRGEELIAEPLTFDLSFRSSEAPDERCHVASAPGIFTVFREPQGHLTVRIDSDPVEWVRSVGELEPGWNRLSIVTGSLPMPSLRIVLNGEANQRVVEKGEFHGPADLLFVGGARRGAPGLAMVVDEVSLRAQSLSTDELIAEATAPAPGYHTLSVERPSGTTERDVWFGELEQSSVTETDWQLSELRHLIADDQGLRWAPAQWEQDDPELRPSPRTAHAMAFVGDHEVVMFGGEARDSHADPQINADDTWIYDTENQAWREVETQLRPPARCHVPAAYSPVDDFVLLVGGLLNGQFVQNTTMSDTWGFLPATGEWRQLDPTGTAPKFSDPGLVFHEGMGAFVLFHYSHVLAFSTEHNSWTRMPAPRCIDTNGKPVTYAAGGSPMTLYDPESHGILIFGGSLLEGGQKTYQATTAWYDLKSNTFVVESHDVAPSPRVRAGFSLDQQRRLAVLFGGVQGQFSTREGDLWFYDLERRRWREVEAANSPSARGGLYGMSYDPALDRHFLICGRPTPERFLNEVWRLSIDERAWGEARFVFARSAFHGRATWSADWSAPAGMAPEFRFRATVDGEHWTGWGTELASVLADDSAWLEVELRLPPGAESVVSAMGFLDSDEAATRSGRTVLATGY